MEQNKEHTPTIEEVWIEVPELPDDYDLRKYAAVINQDLRKSMLLKKVKVSDTTQYKKETEQLRQENKTLLQRIKALEEENRSLKESLLQP